MRIGEGSEVLVEEAIDTAEKNDGWVVIEDLHLAPEKFFNQLKKHLIQVFRSREKLRGLSSFYFAFSIHMIYVFLSRSLRITCYIFE